MNKISMVIPITKETPEILRHEEFLQEFLKKKNRIIIICDKTLDIKHRLIGDVAIFGVEDLVVNSELINCVTYSIDNTENDILIISEDLRPRPTAAGADCFYEEMSECLYVFEKHAAVCIRNEENELLNSAAEKYLPQYHMITEVDETCVLIKRTVIRNHGFLSDKYISLKYSLLDYLHYLNNFGFSTLMANHAFCFCPPGAPAPESDKETLLMNAPAYEKLEYGREDFKTDPRLWFLDILAHGYYEKPKILFEYAIMVPKHVGQSEYMINLLEEFSNLYSDKYDISLLITKRGDEFHNFSSKYKVYYPDTIEGKFHLGYSIRQPLFYYGAKHLSCHCLKIVYSVMDLILLRTHYARYDQRLAEIFMINMNISDGAIALSNYGINDYKSFFPSRDAVAEIPIKPIYLTSDFKPNHNNNVQLPFDKFFFIPGNNFLHKAVFPALSAVQKTKYNFIVLTGIESSYITENVYNYKSGPQSVELINSLYSRCEAVIFPSHYEGFGLPILNALLCNKRVFLQNNALNRELAENLLSGYKNHLIFFDRLTQLPQLLESTDFSAPLPKVEFTRTWKDVAIETEAFFDEIIKKETNPQKLVDRWSRLILQ